MVQYIIKTCNVKIKGLSLMQWIGVFCFVYCAIVLDCILCNCARLYIVQLC